MSSFFKRLKRKVRSERFKQQVAGVFFVISFLFASFFLLPVGIRGVTYGYQSQSWPQTTGVIVTSQVETTTGHRSGSRGTGSRQTIDWSNIAYTYEVGGQDYRSTQVAYDSNGGRKETLKFQVGQEVKVYYHPEDPNEAVLEPGIKQGVIMILLFGIAALAAGMLAAVVVIYSWPRNNPESPSPMAAAAD